MPACVCDGLLVILGRGDTGTEFKSGAMSFAQMYYVLTFPCYGLFVAMCSSKLYTPLRDVGRR